ncbi:MAG: hypothetical protein A9183_03080 [Dehalococcoides mccartyi]|uniref:hypothetical protein n=1 Tax=Dehalococcoides mccartyi TaxID=61435 RepID=UPI000805A08F|nr:hypothetical protein [Dehalococcoides mccartyi]OBW61102.1 MAG: hypothetical protein A9183_03080 [Dehalococcoides mccartyi]
MTAPITITINGENITTLEEDSFSVTSILGQTVDTANITIYDKNSELIIPEQVDIAITRTGTGERIFGGLTSMPEASTDGLSRWYKLSCQDYTVLLDATMVFASYPSGFTYDGLSGDKAIIANLFEKAGISLGGGEAPPCEIEARTYVGQALSGMAAMYFNYTSLREAMTTIANYAGWNFYVDYDKHLHYYYKDSDTAPFNLSSSPNGTTSIGYRNLKWKRDGTSVRNFYVMFGTNLFSGLQTYYLSSNGSATTLTLGLADLGRNIILQPPPGYKTILVDINTGTDGTPVWTAKTVGTDGIDTLTSVDCLHNASQQTLSFATPPPNLTNSLRIRGVFMLNGGQADASSESITKYGRIFSKRLVASDANSAAAMAAKLANYKSQYAFALNSCTLTVDDDMFPTADRFKVGQWVHLTNEVLNQGYTSPPLNEKGFMIHSITTRCLGGQKLVYTLDLRDWFTDTAI